MNRSHFKIILFFIPLISYAISFGMKNNGQKIITIKRIYAQKSNLINKKNATKPLLQNSLIEAKPCLIEAKPCLIETKPLLLNCLIKAKDPLAVYLSKKETNTLRLICKAFARYPGYRNDSSSDLLLMPDDIEKQYDLLCSQETDPIKRKEKIKPIIYSTLLGNNNISINWILELNKNKSFKITLNEEFSCQELSITPALVLVNNQELTKNDQLAGILSNEWSKKSPLSEQEIFKLKTITQKSLSGINAKNYASFIPYIIYTSLDNESDLKKLISPDNQINLTKKGTEYLLYLCIHENSPKCFQYLIKTKYGMEISTQDNFNFSYFAQAIYKNQHFADCLLQANFYTIKELENALNKTSEENRNSGLFIKINNYLQSKTTQIKNTQNKK